jgi:hypothetical protein
MNEKSILLSNIIVASLRPSDPMQVAYKIWPDDWSGLIRKFNDE